LPAPAPIVRWAGESRHAKLPVFVLSESAPL
jgi:hypothetical protein